MAQFITEVIEVPNNKVGRGYVLYLLLMLTVRRTWPNIIATIVVPQEKAVRAVFLQYLRTSVLSEVWLRVYPLLSMRRTLSFGRPRAHTRSTRLTLPRVQLLPAGVIRYAEYVQGTRE